MNVIGAACCATRATWCTYCLLPPHMLPSTAFNRSGDAILCCKLLCDVVSSHVIMCCYAMLCYIML